MAARVAPAQYSAWDSTNYAGADVEYAAPMGYAQPSEWDPQVGSVSSRRYGGDPYDGTYAAGYEDPAAYDAGLIYGDYAYDAAAYQNPSITPTDYVADDYSGYGLSSADYAGHALKPQSAYAASGWAAPVETWSQPYDAPQWQASHPPTAYDDASAYEWIILPGGLLYRSYLAGLKEARFQAVWLWEKDRDLIWETTLGGRMGVLRYGTPDRVFGEGFQLDMEGAAFARVDPTLESAPLEAVDFRFGLIGTWRRGPWATKFGYYHLSSHAGDEFLINNPGFVRVNYVRDSLIAGVSYNPTVDTRLYAEMGYAIGHEGGAEPLEFQFGAEYAPYECDPCRGAPFAAINGHFREDFGWIGSVNFVTGWQWRGAESKRALRLGMQLYSGPALQYEFLDRYERLMGLGIWYDY